MKISSLLFVLFVSNVLINYADIAADSSENYTNGVWNNGDNQGIGLQNWVLTQNPNSGFYIGATGAGNSTFGLFADENNFSAAERKFEQALSVGQSFQITLGHTANINGSIGITLFSESEDLINLNFSSGQSNWLLWDGDSTTHSSAAYNPNTPLLFNFIRNNNNEYTYTFAEITQTRNAVSDINQIIGFRIYNNGQGAGENFGFDNIAVIPEPSTIAFLGLSSLCILGLRNEKARNSLLCKKSKNCEKKLGSLEKSRYFDSHINI